MFRKFKPYKFFACILCGFHIKNSHAKQTITPMVDNQSFTKGGVATISFGYGSKHDCDSFVIAICDNCTDKAKSFGRLPHKSYLKAVHLVEDEPKVVHRTRKKDFDQ